MIGRALDGDQVEVVELAAWGFDASVHRPAEHVSAPLPAVRAAGPASLEGDTWALQPLLAAVLARRDLHEEFAGQQPSIQVVDLRELIAFQRRLVLDPLRPAPAVPRQDDWPALLALAFGPPRATEHVWVDERTVNSPNPDLQLRPAADGGLILHGGSPFLEVALLGGRAFLRDGYHRAYRLLAAGVWAVPAVVFQAETLDEVFPAAPWFFPATVLERPDAPRVRDFHDVTLTVRYSRPRSRRTLQLSLQQLSQLQQERELTSV